MDSLRKFAILGCSKEDVYGSAWASFRQYRESDDADRTRTKAAMQTTLDSVADQYPELTSSVADFQPLVDEMVKSSNSIHILLSLMIPRSTPLRPVTSRAATCHGTSYGRTFQRAAGRWLQGDQNLRRVVAKTRVSVDETLLRFDVVQDRLQWHRSRCKLLLKCCNNVNDPTSGSKHFFVSNLLTLTHFKPCFFAKKPTSRRDSKFVIRKRSIFPC